MIKRNEKETDYERVEEITRKAFWNLYVPGRIEHYLVHVMRSHKDFLPELDLVIEADNQVIGNIMYTKTKLIDEAGEEKDILTFGPVCILPEYQRKGYGKQLMEHSFEQEAGALMTVWKVWRKNISQVRKNFIFSAMLLSSEFPLAVKKAG